MSSTQQGTIRKLLEAHGTTFAADADITLRDEPACLWQLLVLAQLLSTRISSDIAVATARELWKAEWRTPANLRRSTWQQRVNALGRGGYRRYDESTATRLEANVVLLDERWNGDLRELRDEADGDAAGIAELLQTFDGIGPTGADIFLREVQDVWPSVAPYADKLVVRGAKAAGLPTTPDELFALCPSGRAAHLAAALVRVARKPSILERL